MSRTSRVRRLGALVAIGAAALAAVLVVPAGAASTPTVSPGNRSYSYDAGPFTNFNVGGLLLGSCSVPQGCDDHQVKIDVPASYYQNLRRAGRVGAVEISLSWENNVNDFDLGLLDKDGNVMATSGFGNSDFEKIVYTELPSGTYTVETAIFRSVNTSFHARVQLVDIKSGASAVAPGTADLGFSNGTPATFERSSGEPNMVSDPANGDLYADM